MRELIGKRTVKGFDIDEYKENGTQTIEWYKEKITAIRNEKKAWMVQDDEDERNGWTNFCQINGANQQMEVGKKNVLTK